jgi:hypothetical protein
MMIDLISLIYNIYGTFEFTGLYSFEFVDSQRNTIVEIFMMMPPKSKDMSEPTRSNIVPTLGGNYLLDAGNGIKTMNLSGKLYFPSYGSSSNPVARDTQGLAPITSGLEEFFALRYMLIRCRDYTMTSNSSIDAPISALIGKPEIGSLYQEVSSKIKSKVGALYDQIQLIVHDYDMNDHYYCKVANFSSSQSDSSYLSIDYTIELELYRPDEKGRVASNDIKPEVNFLINAITTAINLLDYPSRLEEIQSQIGLDYELQDTLIDIETNITDLNTANTDIQSGQSAVQNVLPQIVSSMASNISFSLANIIETNLSEEQQEDYEDGNLTIGEILDRNVVEFYNTLQKISLEITSMDGILKSMPVYDTISFNSNSSDYKLTEEQFDDNDSGEIQNEVDFQYYEVLSGDTSRSIALKTLKDPSKFSNILKSTILLKMI